MWLTGLVAPRHVGSSQTRARTRVPCIGRQILNHCATREAPSVEFLSTLFFQSLEHCPKTGSVLLTRNKTNVKPKQMVIYKACPGTRYSVTFNTVLGSFCLSDSCTCIRLSCQRPQTIFCSSCVCPMFITGSDIDVSLSMTDRIGRKLPRFPGCVCWG